MNLQETSELAKKAADVQWVKWVHPWTKPAETYEEKKKNVIIANIIKLHCAICLNTNGCCFAKNNCPREEQHYNCHCHFKNINNISITTYCPIEKFTKYIFNENYNDGKANIFYNLGYTIADSTTLKLEMEKQAYYAYLTGNYLLNVLDSYGQRIDIYITLSSPSGKKYTFKTGWMTYPNGKIVLVTPYGGR